MRESGSVELDLRACQSRLETYTPQQRVLHADPISDVIGLSALIVSLFGVEAATGTAIGGALIKLGISLAASYAAQALLPKPVVGTSANSPEVRYNTRQPVPTKRIIYGSAQVGGSLFFEQAVAPYLYHGLLVCAKKVTTFQKLWIGTTAISLPIASLESFTLGHDDHGNHNTIPAGVLIPIASVGQPNYPGRLRVSFRVGERDQAIDPLLAADFTGLSTEFRQRGIATACFRYEYGADITEFTSLWGQVQRPNPLLLVAGIAIPDPRNPSHIIDWDPDDPDSVAEAEDSWSFSNTASLVQAHYLTQRYGGRIHPSKIDWDKVAASADYDDEVIGCLDGTFIRKHTLDGVINLDQQPYAIIQAMLTANRGFVLESGGRVWVASSMPRTPVATIYDGNLTSGFVFNADKAKRDTLNKIKSRFVSSERSYQVVDGPILSKTDLQATDGEILETTIDMPFTFDYRRVQRSQKAALEVSRLGKSLTVRVDVSILADAEDDLVGNSVIISSDLFPNINGTYFVTSVAFTATFSEIELALTEYDPTIETDWDASVDEQTFVLEDVGVSYGEDGSGGSHDE